MKIPARRRSRIWLVVATIAGLLVVAIAAASFSDLWIAKGVPAPQADLVAYVGSDRNVYTIAPDGTGRKQVTQLSGSDPPGGDIFRGLAWSPDGKYLSFTRVTAIPSTHPVTYTLAAFLYQPESEELHQVDLQGSFTSLVWAADSSGLLYDREITWNEGAQPAGPIYGIWMYDLATGQSTEVVPPAHHYPLAVRSVSPDGRYISFEEMMHIDGPGSFGYFDLQTQAYHAWDQKEDLQPGSVDWSPDGQSLIYDRIVYGIRPGSQIWRADPVFGRVDPLTPSDKNFSAFLPHFAPGGEQIAYFYQRGQFIDPPELWVMNTDGSDRHRAAGSVDGVSFSWSPDGEQIAYTLKQGQVFNVAVVESAGVQSRTIAGGRLPAWRPKGGG